MRVDPLVLQPLWSAFAHAARNAVDHGIETPIERLAANKSAFGTLRLFCEVQGGNLCIELTDDGAGVDWRAVRAKAQKLGLPCETQAELTDALFHQGLSCKEQVSELSGRGVGLSALRHAAESLGGSVELETQASLGTTLRVRLPSSVIWQPVLEEARAA
ncbi:MAG: two-component system chemotaxis sensor kinase CheA [Cognaticolwellia sp.]